MKNSVLAVIVFIAFLASSCSELLTATFESDAINSPPATDLPGAPEGDAIQFNAAMSPQLKVQNSDISGAKALFYSNAAVDNPPPVASRWISFKGKGTDLTETIWFQHTGENMGSSIFIDVSDGHLGLMARMRIKPDGEVAVSAALNDGYSDVIGNLVSGAHTIIFAAFTSTLKYNVTILQSAGPTITASNKPMITDNLLSFANPANPTLSFLQEGSGSLTYAIGSVNISRKKP
jgi:hypothetical protein